MHTPFSGWLKSPRSNPETDAPAMAAAMLNVLQPIYIVDVHGTPGVCRNGEVVMGDDAASQPDGFPLIAFAPPLHPKNLGNAGFKKRYQLRYPYISGAMAHGIASVELTKAAALSGMMGFFGAAGLSLTHLEKTIFQLKKELGDLPFGVNIVYSGNDALERATIDLFMKHNIRRISAAGYLKLTPSLLCFRIRGIHQNPDGKVICPNKIIAKTSRLEIARQFLSPPPEKMVRQLLDQKRITIDEARLSHLIPVAEDLTAEADSGGHTDNRAAFSLLPSMLDLRDALCHEFKYAALPCIGLGGGIGTPLSVCAAFSMGADYVLAGSVHQSCIESGTSDIVRKMLAEASQTDITMAPSANMFERGIKVQVLKRGTLFAQRAAKLYELYRAHDSIDHLPDDQKKDLEANFFQNTLDEQWQSTRQFFEAYDPAQIELAEKEPKRKMALMFRSYLGQSSKWAISGDLSRKKDFQIWCGPAMGAFNEWSRGSFLETPASRNFQTVAMNLLLGACVAMRRQWLISSGWNLLPHIGKFKPIELQQIRMILNNDL
ncbi:MAG: PfaD family polyunsaturated fatty acid/polyketide biosynthesis protein [Desulfobacteraceae bacterium]|nr:MAG: PfaD family polyunsaturated fatty acid/polyketide biosynthesis protein [Desulfobacteraceae bacterium]